LQERGTTQNLIASSVLKLWLLRRAWCIQPARRRRRSRGGGRGGREGEEDKNENGGFWEEII